MTTPTDNDNGNADNGNAHKCADKADKDHHISRHPMVVLVAGGILSAFFVPDISDRITHTRALTTARSAEAAEVLKVSNQINKQVFLIANVLSNFERDRTNFPVDDAQYKVDQKEFRQQYYALSAEFDSFAWWAFHDISSQASLLGTLPEKKITSFNEEINNYNKNLSETTAQFKGPRDEFFSSRRGPEAASKVNSMNVSLEKLREERALITRRMVQLFR